MSTEVVVTPPAREELEGLLRSQPARVDSDEGITVYGPLEGALSHLVLVVADDKARIPTGDVMFPVSRDLVDRGFLGLAETYLKGPAH